MKFKVKELTEELKSLSRLLSLVFRLLFRTTQMIVRNGRNRKKGYPHVSGPNFTDNSVNYLLINLEINEILYVAASFVLH